MTGNRWLAVVQSALTPYSQPRASPYGRGSPAGIAPAISARASGLRCLLSLGGLGPKRTWGSPAGFHYSTQLAAARAADFHVADPAGVSVTADTSIAATPRTSLQAEADTIAGRLVNTAEAQQRRVRLRLSEAVQIKPCLDRLAPARDALLEPSSERRERWRLLLWLRFTRHGRSRPSPRRFLGRVRRFD